MTTTRTHYRSGYRITTLPTLFLGFLLTACSGEHTDSEGRSLPTDEQVVADVMPDDVENVVDIRTVDGKSGTAYFHGNDRAWYFDRGVVVRRKAGLAELPDALIVVGGLARYVFDGSRYDFSRFIVSYNEYEGIPAPKAEELESFVSKNLGQVFVSREHNVLGVAEIELQHGLPWTWHSPASFTAPFRIRYRYRTTNTTIEERDNQFDVRFYKSSAAAPIHALMATEQKFHLISSTEIDAQELDGMKTLLTSFQ